MKLLNNFKNAMAKSEKVRPKIGGFPYLAECLREEGFTKNTWYLPSGDSFYFTSEDSLVIPGKPLIGDMVLLRSLKIKRALSELRIS